MDIKYTTYHGFAWERFLAEGFTDVDLRLVCGYLRREIRSGKSKLTMASLKFRNLIEDLPAFADHRAIALACARKAVAAPDKARVLRATGREESPPQAKPEAVAGLVERCLQQIRKEIE